jgi:hypothetical protein
MQPGGGKVRRGSPGSRPGIFHMSIAKDYIGSATVMIARETVCKQAVRVVTVSVIVVAGIIIGDGDHIARRDDGTVGNTPSRTNRSAKHH